MAGDDEESKWIQASRQGDHEAYELLVARYQKMIHSVTFRMTGEASDAEDLAQEIFVAAWSQLPSFGGRSSFSSWLYRIAVNRCLNWRRSVARRKVAYTRWQEEAEEAAERAPDESDRVQEAILQLAPKLRAAIVLTVYEEMTHAEAGKALNCSETTISWRVFKARRQLRKFLGHAENSGGTR